MPKKKLLSELPPEAIAKLKPRGPKLAKEAPPKALARWGERRRGPKLLKELPPKKVEPLTIMKIKPPPGRSPMKIKPPPIGLGMEHPGLLKTPKPIKLKPAPRRSPTLKWNIKKR